MKTGYWLTALLLLGGAGGVWYFGDEHAAPPAPGSHALLDQPAPAFRLGRLWEPEQTVTEQIFRGQVSLLNVWGSWCASCRQEHDLLMRVAASGVPIIGLNYVDDREKALDYLRKRGDPYQLTIFDPNGETGEIYDLMATPITYLIDREGVIRYRHLGMIKEDFYQTRLLPLIRKL